MVEERIRFVWEKKIEVRPRKAEKMRTWAEMKRRAELIEEEIQKLEEILQISEAAERYGVLKKDSYRSAVSKIEFGNGILEFRVGDYMKEALGVSDDEEAKQKIAEGWKGALEAVMAWQKEQKRIHEEYMKEAEPYLVVEVEEERGEE